MKESLVCFLNNTNRRRLAGWVLGFGLLILVTFYLRNALVADARGSVRLNVYAFSTQEEVFAQGILPAFEQFWEAETGRDLIIKAVFGASGTLAEQINLGAPADVALLSNAQHVAWLKVGRRVNRGTQCVVFGRTPMVVVTRTDSEASIVTFADLTQPGLRLLHAAPRQSGAGDWAVLAEYGSAWFESGDRAAAEEQLEAIWRNVVLMGTSARATLTLFELGAGDALITYEQDARLALQRGVELQISIPRRTIVADYVAVPIDSNLSPTERSVARAFMDYLISDAGQVILSQYHLRPPSFDSTSFPTLEQPFTVEDLGGWPQAYSALIETLWREKIERRFGLELETKLRAPGE